MWVLSFPAAPRIFNLLNRWCFGISRCNPPLPVSILNSLGSDAWAWLCCWASCIALLKCSSSKPWPSAGGCLTISQSVLEMCMLLVSHLFRKHQTVLNDFCFKSNQLLDLEHGKYVTLEMSQGGWYWLWLLQLFNICKEPNLWDLIRSQACCYESKPRVMSHKGASVVHIFCCISS